METSYQQSQNTHTLIDHYYDEAFSNSQNESLSNISQYDSCVEFVSDTWKPNYSRVSDLRAQLEEYMEGDIEFINEFAGYIFHNMVNLEDQLPELYNSKNIDALNKLNHMIKPTIQMLGDLTLIDELNKLASEWKAGNFQKSKVSRIISQAQYIQSQLQVIVNSNNEAA
ncbi:hypothetical protein [Ekhidna sp.]